MKFNLGAASFLALALFTLPASAQDAQPAVKQPVAAAPAAQAPAKVIPPEVLALLGDTRPAKDISEDELRQRAHMARRFAQDAQLPPEDRQKLAAMAAAAMAELQARKQAQQPAPAPKPVAQAPAPAAPKVEQPAAAAPAAAAKVEAAPVPAVQPIPAEVEALLGDDRAPADLSQGDLVNRAKMARHFAQDGNLPPNMRQKLQSIGAAAIAELETRKQAQQPAAAAPVKPAAQAQVPAAPAPAPAKPAAAAANPPPAVQPAVMPPELEALLGDTRPLAKLTLDELKLHAKTARHFARDQQLPADIRAQLTTIDQQARAELLSRDQLQATPQQVPASQPAAPVVADKVPLSPPASTLPGAKPADQPVPSAAAVQALDSNAGDPAAEKQAQAYLQDHADIAKLSDDDLRKRLDGVRDLMAANELSRETERAVRNKLKAERDVLRERFAKAEAAKQLKDAQANANTPPPQVSVPAGAQAGKPIPPPPPPPPPNMPPVKGQAPAPAGNPGVITSVTPPQMVLRDRRPAENLNLSELQIRIEIFANAQGDQQYDPGYRRYWRDSMLRDREILRRRMIMERHRREQELAMQAANDSIDVNIDEYSDSNRRPPRDVFAAEVDDREMQDVLQAPPRRRFQQQYSVRDIADQPELRSAVSRIEIDTIHFGFREGFLRDEQISKLDAIAAIIERIVKKYPNEVFLIEGHTDAVGSPAANLKLSKLRAESVKKALTSYYVIPARNLRTVGLGERFLKIPTLIQNQRTAACRLPASRHCSVPITKAKLASNLKAHTFQKEVCVFM